MLQQDEFGIENNGLNNGVFSDSSSVLCLEAKEGLLKCIRFIE